MEVESKLDEDFIFFLGFMRPFLRKLSDQDVREKCEIWLQKLCGEKCEGVSRKRCRNIYLANLVFCMQNEKLTEPFLVPPYEVDISNAFDVFELTPSIDEAPEFYLEKDFSPEICDTNATRTYVATHTLPDNQGALAFIGLSVESDEKCLTILGEGDGQKSSETAKDKEAEDKLFEIFARRKDPAEREKVIIYYKVILENIEDELKGKVTAENNIGVNELLEKIVYELEQQNKYGPFQGLDDNTRRIELLTLMHERVKTRLIKTVEREELLDGVEKALMTKKFLETSVITDDKDSLPSKMWEQVISKAPGKKNLNKLHINYPLPLIDMFLNLLSEYKETIAVKMQQRYENIVGQMKKEVRKEGEKGKKNVEEAERRHAEIAEIYQSVKGAYLKYQATDQGLGGGLESSSEHSKLYDEMRKALMATQQSVEEEAARGKMIADQINLIYEQAEIFKDANEEHVKKAEEANIAIMKNIRRLNVSIKQHRERIEQIKTQIKINKSGSTIDFK